MVGSFVTVLQVLQDARLSEGFTGCKTFRMHMGYGWQGATITGCSTCLYCRMHGLLVAGCLELPLYVDGLAWHMGYGWQDAIVVFQATMDTMHNVGQDLLVANGLWLAGCTGV